ncbi:pertactin-like passenger domain-containing protein [Bartonella sp. AU18XJBT]|uniref:pertactin-like passenger domain-containing protein n=1 Tax=Bartonella sp. AU18XJBT TaxID=3019089 RepID=UPI00235FE86E|nr:pertactin-like passenger domain-containing protein [Bartonella sp. AU18XJBT]
MIEDLSGNGRVVFTSTVFKPHYSKLEVGNLSGNLHFRFNTNFAEQCGDYLLIKKEQVVTPSALSILVLK